MKNTILHRVSFVRQTSFKFLTRSFALLMLLALGSSSLWATDFTLSSANSVTKDGITVSFGAGTNTDNSPTWYSAGLRLYPANTVTISSSSNITAITFNWEKQGSKTFASASASTGTYSHPSSAGAGTWTGSAKSITFTVTGLGQLQLNTLSVTAGSASKIDVTLSRNGSTQTISNQSSPYTLPAAASEDDACTDWVFKGWSTSPVTSTTTEPSYVTSVSSTTTVYAVYGKTEGSSTPTTTTYTLNGNWTTDNGNWTKLSGNLSSSLATDKYGINSGSTSASSPQSYTGITTVKFTGTKSSAGAGSVEVWYKSGSSWTSLGSKSFGNSLTWSPSTPVSGELKLQMTRTNGNIYIASIAVTYSDATTTYTTSPDCKTLDYITIKTEPTKTYTEGEYFDPTGLVITKHYSNASPEDLAYAGHESDFTFNPSTSTALQTSNNKVTITVGGKSVDLGITVNAIPTHTISWLVNNSSVKSESKKEGVKLKTLTMPPTPADGDLPCSDKFMGWSRTNLGAALGQDAPDDLFTDITKFPDSEVVGSSDITFYAVFASSTSAGGSSSITSFATGDYLLIDTYGSNYYAMSGSGKSVTGVDISSAVTKNADGTISVDASKSVITDAMLYTIGGTAPAATVYNIEDKKYVQGGSSTDFTQSTSNKWTVTEKNDRFTFVYTSESRCILYKDGTGFKNYATSNRGGSGYGTGYLYLAPATGYEDYVTSCGKSLSIKPKTLTAERPFVGTGTLTATANLYTPSGYTWTSDNESVATVSGSGATATVTYLASGSCTITCSAPDGSTPMTATATVTVPASYKVTWDVNGSTTDQYYLLTESPVMPDAPEENCGTKVFVGWTNASIPTEQAVAPTTLYTSQSDFTSLKTAATYYAVFADESEASNTYSIINYDSELTSGDYVIEAYYNSKDYAMGTGIDASGKITGTLITATDEITLTSGQESLVWTITRNEDNELTFKNKSTNQYLNIVSSGSYGKLELGNLGDASKYTFTITNNGTGYSKSWIFYSENISGQQLENFQGVFQSYNNQAAKIYLYKKVLSYTAFTTVCGPTIRVDEYKYIVSGKDITIKSANIPVSGNNLESATTLSVTRKSGSANLSAMLNNATVSGGVTTNASLVISYHPTAFNTTETATFEIKDNLNQTSALFEITGISLPEKFVIASKVDDQWYSLPGNIDLFDTYSGVPTTMDNADNPTRVAVVDPIAAYSVMALTNSADVNDRLIHLSSLNTGILCVSTTSSETGIRNYANTHANELAAVSRWTIATLDGVSYTITSASKSSPLRYNRSGNKLWGMYASGTETFRIIPITALTDECVYLREPMALKAVALASTATLTFKKIPGATNYEYSLNNGSSWTDVASFAVNTSDKNYIDAVVDGLMSSTSYTILLRAKSVTDVCATPVAASVNIKTTACDDTPLLGGEAATTTTTATISWTCRAATSDIVFYTDDTYSVEATTPAKITGVSSPYTITDLTKNTTYYYKVFAGGTCESVGSSFLTATPEVEVVNWNPNYIDLDLNIDGTPAAVIQKQVTEGTGEDVYADDIFFSKYFEAKGNLKLIGIYNGTAAPVSLNNVIITFVKVAENSGSSKGNNIEWEKSNRQETLNLSPLGEIPAKTEYIFYTVTSDESDIAACIQSAVGWDKDNWFPTNSESASTISAQTGKTISCPFLGAPNGNSGMKLQFNGTRAVSMWRGENMIDLIGHGTTSGASGEHVQKAPKGCVKIGGEMRCDVPLNDDSGWFCADGIDYETKDSSALSTNRFLLIRKNIVRAGYSTPAQIESMTTHGVGTESAVASNGDNFNTLCTEWEGRAIGKFSDGEEDVITTCENFNLVSDFNYSNYYTSFRNIGDTVLLNEHNQNPDGTFRLYLKDLDSLSCQPLKIKVFNGKGGEVMFEREYTVPIMIMSNSTTNSDYFALWNEGNPNSNPTPRTEEECKKCNVVVLNNITLTKDSKVPEVHDITVYPGAQLIVPNGQTLKANTITFRRDNDEVPSAYLYNNSSLDLSATTEVYFNFRLDAKNWYWLTLPYACNVNDVTFSSGYKATYGIDWFLKYYDGEIRAANRSGGWQLVPAGTTLEPGVGYIIGIADDPNPDYKAELRFPMAQYSEQGTKNVGVRNWGEDKADPADYNNIQSNELTPNNKGWQLVGNPFFAFDQNTLSGQNILEGSLQQVSLDPNGHTYQRSGTNRYITITDDHGSSYTQMLASSKKLAPFTSYFVQIGVGSGAATPVKDYSLAFNASERTQDKTDSAPARRMLMHAEDEMDNMNTDEPVFVGLSIVAPNGELDETALAINDQYELDKYEMGFDLAKWKGDSYTRLKKPLIYTMAGTNERSFNAMARKESEQMIPVGFYAYNTDAYTVQFNPTYTEYLGSIQELTLYDAVMNTYTDLLKYDYTFVPNKKGDCKDRLFIIAKIAERIDVQTGMGKASILTDEICKFITPDGQLHVARKGVIYDAQGRIEQVIR